MQASAATHTELPTLGKICRRQTISRLRCHVSRRLRLVTGTTKEEQIQESYVMGVRGKQVTCINFWALYRRMPLGDPARFMLVMTDTDSLLATDSSFPTGRFLSVTKRVTRTEVFTLMLEALQRETRSSRRCSGKPVTRLQYRHLGLRKKRCRF